jgi:propanol-preferring alcohol dehydrogenase
MSHSLSRGPCDVLVRITATGVCGTDFALSSGKLGTSRRILGHEGVARVVQLGTAIPIEKVKVGQRVGLAWVCGTLRKFRDVYI